MSKKWIFTIITFMIGFMIAIQFQTTKEPVIRDTRDIRELRKELHAEEEKKQQLTIEINKAERLLTKYKQSMEYREDDILEVLTEQIADLKYEAGLETKTGKGLILTIDSLDDMQIGTGKDRRIPPPEVFRTLVNELNIYGAEAIAIENERIISVSAFRDVNNITFLNSRRLPPSPIQVKVLSKDPEILQNHMVVSESVDDLEINGFSLSFEMRDVITLPAYDRTPRVRYMEKVKEG